MLKNQHNIIIVEIKIKYFMKLTFMLGKLQLEQLLNAIITERVKKWDLHFLAMWDSKMKDIWILLKLLRP